MKPTRKELNRLCRLHLFLKLHPKKLPTGYDGLAEYSIEVLLQRYNISKITLLHEATIYEQRQILKEASKVIMLLDAAIQNTIK